MVLHLYSPKKFSPKAYKALGGGSSAAIWTVLSLLNPTFGPQGPIGGPLKLRDAHRFNVLAVCNVAIYSSLVLVCLHDGLEMDDAFIYNHCLTFSDLDGTPRNYNLPKLSKYRMIDIRAKFR